MILEYKFSSIGKFDELESTPEFVYKLQPIYMQFGLMPNNITIQELSNMGIVTRYRPQLIDIGNGISIDFLPDRIDIVFRHGKHNLVDATCKAAEIFKKIGEVLEVKPVRFASIIQGIYENKTATKAFDKSEFLNEDIFFEWSFRTVHRKEITIAGLSDKINVVLICERPETGINVGIGPEVKNYKGILYTIDINTFVPSKRGGFDFIHFKDFSEQINTEIERVTSTLDIISY